MFADTKAFGSFAVDDLERARDFYAGTLGLNVSEESGLLWLHLAGNGGMLVYPKPDHTPATHTILNLSVEDVGEAVDALAERGVSFERYDGMNQDERGIAAPRDGPRIAWFKDPAGNILAVLQEA